MSAGNICECEWPYKLYSLRARYSIEYYRRNELLLMYTWQICKRRAEHYVRYLCRWQVHEWKWSHDVHGLRLRRASAFRGAVLLPEMRTWI